MVPPKKEVPIDPRLLDRYAGFTQVGLRDDGDMSVDKQWERLQLAVESLPEQERWAVELVYWGQRGKRSAAREMNVSCSTLYRLLASAKLRLRNVLTITEEGDTLGP